MKNKSGGIENLIRKMLKKHSSPLMLIQEDMLEKQFKTFRKALPEVTPYYAIKANPFPTLLENPLLGVFALLPADSGPSGIPLYRRLSLDRPPAPKLPLPDTVSLHH